MREAAAAMDFELAAQLRDQLFEVRAQRETRARSDDVAGGRVARRRAECRTHPHRPAARGARTSRAAAESELVEWGERFGRVASPPLVVTLTGELGAGKTTLVQAICRGYGVTEDVTSPTFALVHRYAAPRSPVFHLDLYRLEIADGADEHRLGRDARRRRAGARRVAGAGGRSHCRTTTCRSVSQHLPDDPARRLLYAGGHVVITLALDASTYAGDVARARRRDACSRRRASR